MIVALWGGQGSREISRAGVLGPVAVIVAVVMAVPMPVPMAVIVAVVMAGLERIGGEAGSQGRRHLTILLTGPGAFPFAEGAAIGETLNVMVMAVLGGSHLRLKAEHLGAVLAERTVHVRVPAQHVEHALPEGVDHQGVITQVGGGQKLDRRVIDGDSLGVGKDPTDQDPREEEVRRHDDAPESESDGMAKAGLHQGKGDPGVHRFAPTETKTLHQHPGHLGDVGVGIGIRRTTAHHHQQGVVKWHLRGTIKSLTNAGRRRLDHVAINAELPAVIDAEAGFGAVGLQNRRNVVFGMAGCEQHRRHRKHVLNPLGSQAIEAIAKNRSGKFQVSVGHRHRGKGVPKLLRQFGELRHRQAVSTAMTTDKDPQTALRTIDGKRRGGGSHALPDLK